ncbi:RAD52 motif-containing protein 1 isoform X3 [Rhineura floridana]|uniref:RAD52 motif-containing protein 1 isoform X3 n=1 Tax=Rhineura floridana TaxID=261503 RepID=UPI002AC80816|nr:RAD52 motif-containing protein 1 isoform X3 [Rhineura floridana]
MVEIVEFRVPAGNGRTLLVLGLETGASEHALYLAFSTFGPLYSVGVHQNAPVAGPGYYALVKFYSARDACKAQCACNQQSLFQKSPLKVYICTRQRPFPQQVLALNSYKCRELANHYLGFNGWSSRIITLQNISGFEEEENEEVTTSSRKQHSKYLCVQELTFPLYGVRTRGVGVAELHIDPNQENGKVAVEYSSPQEDPIDCLTEEELKGLLQVTELSLSQLGPIEEEEISDLTMQ